MMNHHLISNGPGAMAPKATVNFIASAPTLENGGVDASAPYAVENNIGDIISLSYGAGEPLNGAAGTASFNNLWEYYCFSVDII